MSRPVYDWSRLREKAKEKGLKIVSREKDQPVKLVFSLSLVLSVQISFRFICSSQGLSKTIRRWTFSFCAKR